PDVRAAERRLAAASANVGVATAALYPALRLSGNVGFSADAIDTLLRPAAATSSLLAGLTAPVFDGGRLRRALEIRDAQQEQALIAYERSVAQALADVETALSALARNGERLQTLTAAAASAGEAATLARQRYAAGLIDYTTLQDTLRAALSTDDTRASASGERLAATVQLYKALGGGTPPVAAREPDAP
ncbi:MAG: TolC family protein, partial [Candidatus Dactylopiibacterium sp.]|nr:TolC family protein [Candidatus Dactylopiibacterium sp.]